MVEMGTTGTSEESQTGETQGFKELCFSLADRRPALSLSFREERF